MFNLFVNPEPIADFNINNSEQCFNRHEFIFENNSSIPNGSFSSELFLGDNTKNTPFSTYNYKYASFKNYNVKLKITSDSSCLDSIIKVVKVFESPDAAIFVNDSDQCLNGNIFDLKLAKKPIATYTADWEINDGTKYLAMDAIKHSFGRYGNYNAQVIVTSGENCKDTALQNLYVHPSPIPNFSVKSVCFPEPSEFINLSKIDSGSIVSNNWLINNAKSYSSENVTHYFNNPGVYDASLSVTSDNGCTENILLKNIAFVK